MQLFYHFLTMSMINAQLKKTTKVPKYKNEVYNTLFKIDVKDVYV